MSRADDLKAELEYLNQRVQEQTEVLAGNLRDLSEAIGHEIASEDVTPELMQSLLGTVVETLRQLGNEPLASRYAAAAAAMNRASQQLLEKVEELRACPSITDDDVGSLDALRNASDDAVEQFERVEAGTESFLTSR